MNYSDILERAIKGRSINSISKAWDVPQPVLRRYLTGQRLPSFKVAKLIASAANISASLMLDTLVKEEEERKQEEERKHRRPPPA